MTETTTIMALDVSTSADSAKPTGAGTPADALELPSMSQSDSHGQESTECPTCGRDDFASVASMKSHHAVKHGESIAGIPAECDYCGASFRRRKSQLEKSEHHFCSPMCRGEWSSENIVGENHHDWEGGDVEVDCSWCGDITTVRPAVADRPGENFCSEKCLGQWNASKRVGETHPQYDRVKVQCAYCGREKRVKQHVADENQRHFCGYTCMGEWQSENQVGEGNPGWKGGRPEYYGANWPTQREKALDRDDHRCQACGMTSAAHQEQWDEGLHVHHITRFKSFDNSERANELSNLVALCRGCHVGMWEGIPLRPQLLD